MTRQFDDQLLESWLAEGPSELPDRVINNILNNLDENSAPWWRPDRRRTNRMMFALGGVATVVIAISGAAAYIARNSSPPGAPGGPIPTVTSHPTSTPGPIPTSTPGSVPTSTAESSYEAVFLRRHTSTDVLVVGVDSQGQERLIARLPAAWSNDPTPAPVGAISPSGLLIIPDAGAGPFEVRWTIFDVVGPKATPVLVEGIAEQDTDQLSYSYFVNSTCESCDARASWGPNDQLAIYWYERIPQGGNSFGRNYFVTYVDGRTGAFTSVDIPDEYAFLPSWASDGSGIVVEQTPDPQILRADGTLVPASETVPEASCNRVDLGSDVEPPTDQAAVCLSPDSSLTARSLGRVDEPTGLVTVEETGESFDVVGRFAGWLRVDL